MKNRLLSRLSKPRIKETETKDGGKTFEFSCDLTKDGRLKRVLELFRLERLFVLVDGLDPEAVGLLEDFAKNAGIARFATCETGGKRTVRQFTIELEGENLARFLSLLEGTSYEDIEFAFPDPDFFAPEKRQPLFKKVPSANEPRQTFFMDYCPANYDEVYIGVDADLAKGVGKEEIEQVVRLSRLMKEMGSALKFFASETQYIFTGQPLWIGSEIAFKCPPYGDDATIEFGGWGQELCVLSETKTLVCFQAAFSPKKVKKAILRLPKPVDAKITVDRIENTKKALPIFYDEQTRWFCFGNKDYAGKGYRFATDTVAVIDGDRLEAVFIRPEKLPAEGTDGI